MTLPPGICLCALYNVADMAVCDFHLSHKGQRGSPLAPSPGSLAPGEASGHFVRTPRHPGEGPTAAVSHSVKPSHGCGLRREAGTTSKATQTFAFYELWEV